MQLDLIGKINEKKLAYSNTLLPLYEAIVNSIQAIEENSATEIGLINIGVVRDRQTNLNDKNSKGFVIGFNIKDNGIGFNSKNFDSFNYAHSTYKASKGGKGIGRFVWLRAFNKVEIESKYQENEDWFFRKFDFRRTKQGIENHNNDKTNGTSKRFTEVRLIGLKKDYQKWCNQEIEEIALKIIEHCFVYFLDPKCPRIKLIDAENEIVVNDLFNLFTKGQVKKHKIKLRKLDFELNLVKVYSNRLDNKIHFCAHTREVTSDKLNQDIPELDSFLFDNNNESFSIAAYLTGVYLDEKVNEERTSIAFAKNNEESIKFPDEASREEITSKVTDKIQEIFSAELEGVSKVRFKRIEDFIHDNPRYKQLLKYRPNQLKRVNTKLPNEKLEIEIFKIQQDLDLEVKKETRDALSFIDNAKDKEEFESKFHDLYQKIIEVGNSKLSEYIIHRKLVLELLEKQILPTNEGKFHKEETVHKLVFPLKRLSEDVSYDDHNLWIIDEKLSYHKYLASDKRFKEIEATDSKSKDRPDIIIFNRPFAFVNDEKPYESVVIIEFKRPMRDDYTEEENPISQVNRYVREIIDGDVKDKNNREFDLRENTPIYSYIICDMTKKLKSFAKDAGYKLLPDGGGYFNFNDNYNMYIEIISFDKLIRDSKKRNKVLFDKLNMG